ncbi:hypothetical protein LTR56_022944 [Elasticomyces elasticus]|nr:hypothetical protein LTR56_022944 [Elasticomyces elasticus]KAK3626975.1 hypothetical protein LTR22_022932 [Elasticomyces elasticus]KAK4910818.1 hypothetical protein LTR49_020513 [Elasticomyces elasticus]KAK5750395.1 hypothetical protein LTS12_019503 [Elasticomyces elasticus]
MGWYVLGAWVFGEVYIWSRSEGAGLGWVDMGRAGYERVRVNENPVLLRTVFVCLGIAQAGLHLGRDYDRIEVEETEARLKQGKEASRLPEPLQILSTKVRAITGRVVLLVLPGIVFSTPFYFLFLRRTLWHSVAYPLARTLLLTQSSSLQPNNGPTGILHPLTLLWQTLTSAILLVLLWELSNAIFTLYVSRPPLKKNQPLTSDIKEDSNGAITSRSRDPNGSLIRGLKAAKDVPKSFAFWELNLITTSPLFATRRATIFAEVDRQPTSTWTEIKDACISEIAAISTRIQLSQQPLNATGQPNPQKTQQEALAASQQQRGTQPTGLPRIAGRGVVNDTSVINPSRSSVSGARGGARQAVEMVGGAMKSLSQSQSGAHAQGQQQQGQRTAVGIGGSYGRKAIEYGVSKAGGRGVVGPAWLQGVMGEKVLQFLRTPAGEIFRQGFGRRVRAVVLGVPYGRGGDIVHASRSLTALVVASLREDGFGRVSGDVAGVPHWSDVGFTEAQRDSAGGAEGLEEVKEVLEVLRCGLEEVVLAFGEYAGGLGLTHAEMRAARQIIGVDREGKGGGGKEMEEIGGERKTG